MTSAIILAGGLGTRLREAVPGLPKPMAPIGGRPFLECQMDYWIGEGVDHFVLSVGYMRNIIIDHFGDSYCGISIDYAIEEEPLGTGGGLLLALKKARGDTVLILNGDTFFEVSLTEILKFHRDKKSQWTFALFSSNEDGRYMGVNVSVDGRINSLKSESSSVGALASGGIYVADKVFLKKFSFPKKCSLEDDILNVLFQAGARIFGQQFDGGFIDIGVPRDYKRASSVIKGE
jgi:D-glycero-alpha-D-manno-heptose 1-phosphate guanylyltransferase